MRGVTFAILAGVMLVPGIASASVICKHGDRYYGGIAIKCAPEDESVQLNGLSFPNGRQVCQQGYIACSGTLPCGSDGFEVDHFDCNMRGH